MKLSSQLAVAAGATLTLSLAAAFAVAQGKPAPEKKPPAAAMHADGGAGKECAHGECKHGGCPMMDLHALADVKVEKTKTGATLQLTAKDPAKAGEVQALADKFAEHLKSGRCEMGEGGEGHGHEHGEHGEHHGHPPSK